MIRYLRVIAFRRGVVDDHRLWFALWVVLMGTRLVRRFTSPKPRVLLHEVLAPGEAIVIAHDRQPVEG